MSEERWQVTVRVPMRLPDEQREALFNRVADAVSEWEPEQRVGWDADVAAGSAGDEPMLPTVFGYEVGQRDAKADLDLLLWLHAEAEWRLDVERDRHVSTIADRDRLRELWPTNGFGQETDVRQLIANHRAWTRQAQSEVEWVEASRQAWAEEALRQTSELNDYADLLLTCAESPSPEHLARMLRRMGARRPSACPFVSDGGDCCEEYEGHDGPHLRWFDEIRYEELGQPQTPCVCVTDEQAAALVEAGFTRPQCGVHPENDGA